MSGHNVRTCKMKVMVDLDKQRQEQYIANHPLSLFPRFDERENENKKF